MAAAISHSGLDSSGGAGPDVGPIRGDFLASHGSAQEMLAEFAQTLSDMSGTLSTLRARVKEGDNFHSSNASPKRHSGNLHSRPVSPSSSDRDKFGTAVSSRAKLDRSSEAGLDSPGKRSRGNSVAVVQHVVAQLNSVLQSGRRTLFGSPIFDASSFFDVLDWDRSGVLERAEIIEGFKRLDVPVLASDIDEFVGALDANADGFIAKVEFVNGLAAVRSPHVHLDRYDFLQTSASRPERPLSARSSTGQGSLDTSVRSSLASPSSGRLGRSGRRNYSPGSSQAREVGRGPEHFFYDKSTYTGVQRRQEPSIGMIDGNDEPTPSVASAAPAPRRATSFQTPTQHTPHVQQASAEVDLRRHRAVQQANARSRQYSAKKQIGGTISSTSRPHWAHVSKVPHNFDDARPRLGGTYSMPRVERQRASSLSGGKAGKNSLAGFAVAGGNAGNDPLAGYAVAGGWRTGFPDSRTPHVVSSGVSDAPSPPNVSTGTGTGLAGVVKSATEAELKLELSGIPEADLKKLAAALSGYVQ